LHIEQQQCKMVDDPAYYKLQISGGDLPSSDDGKHTHTHTEWQNLEFGNSLCASFSYNLLVHQIIVLGRQAWRNATRDVKQIL